MSDGKARRTPIRFKEERKMGEGKGQDGALFPSECVCRSERRTGQARREEKSGTGLSSGYGQAACSVPLAPSASRRQQRIWLEPLEPLSTGAQQGCPGAMKLVQDDPAAAAQSRAHVRTSSHSSPAASGGLGLPQPQTPRASHGCPPAPGYSAQAPTKMAVLRWEKGLLPHHVDHRASTSPPPPPRPFLLVSRLSPLPRRPCHGSHGSMGVVSALLVHSARRHSFQQSREHIRIVRRLIDVDPSPVFISTSANPSATCASRRHPSAQSVPRGRPAVACCPVSPVDSQASQRAPLDHRLLSVPCPSPSTAARSRRSTTCRQFHVISCSPRQALALRSLRRIASWRWFWAQGEEAVGRSSLSAPPCPLGETLARLNEVLYTSLVRIRLLPRASSIVVTPGWLPKRVRRSRLSGL
ncbi:hypothetical protein Purlil1_4179 [Purpureocillium lilacinum]|uniref:Uncharacterized protein n=1 Tax=Purpureocillium lilacinum TaxID=33203 RepID=A0ABR0C6G5_PURLI|nr:hypothetical protein Purlil1_4179 [Purpureocillium lilacinum]